MSRIGKEFFQRLGADGLTRVLDDMLDRNRLVKLANACGLEYPGMRTRSQSRKQILADLVARAEQQEATSTAIFRQLKKETAAALKRWNALGAAEKAERLGDKKLLRSKGNLGMHLFFLACDEGDKEEGFESLLARKHLLAIASNGELGRSSTKASGEEARLAKKIARLEKKLQHLDGQLTKARETEKTLKRDLIQRKGDLAESRMLAERLGNQLAAARQAIRDVPKETARGEDTIAELAKAVRKLATEQKKLTHRVEKLPADPPPRPPRPKPVKLDPVLEIAGALQKDLAALRRDTRKGLQEQAKRVDELRSGLPAGEESKEEVAPQKSRRSKGAQRVGVFIDVQNMFYGARRLKGKLDFDALLQAAVRDRRLVQPTAYVVESKEIDQSGFISILQQRAIEVRRKNLSVRADGSMKGDWDMELALDILDAAPRLDVVVLVSGDGDFTSLVKRVKQMGPRVEVIGFPRTTAKSLVQAADHFQPLDRKFMIYPDRSRPRRKTGSGKREPKSAPKATASKTKPPAASEKPKAAPSAEKARAQAK